MPVIKIGLSHAFLGIDRQTDKFDNPYCNDNSIEHPQNFIQHSTNVEAQPARESIYQRLFGFFKTLNSATPFEVCHMHFVILAIYPFTKVEALFFFVITTQKIIFRNAMLNVHSRKGNNICKCSFDLDDYCLNIGFENCVKGNRSTKHEDDYRIVNPCECDFEYPVLFTKRLIDLLSQ
ncbi:uncharacterized protein EV154DRAFT_555946 [Mucor mucedo]|uniref:uncharacterized protein n=1 Tax=Mucor mucedo TaxID=29922 RepID=UPI0022209AE4|nr:uncharacterized protein EV154DRAFT_555946 [Mucor mucedo]KAI7875094.1 hypothetical protein EV154DRAFT_555946 [Mucor mucedo]